MSVHYPIAANAELALNGSLGRAVREREAQALAGEPVEFVRELSGPAFDSYEAAAMAYAGKVDNGGAGTVPPEDRYCDLVEVAVSTAGRASKGGQAEPICVQGRRWPQPPAKLRTSWRLSVGYWRPVRNRPEHQVALDQARAARRNREAERLDPAMLRRMARQPLMPVKPQQPLDIGLFERALPENPEIIIPDE